MIPSTVVQYVGFQSKPLFREYTFNVREGVEQREFTLSIENAAFASRRARFQDGPNICSLRLRTELAGAISQVAPLHYQITGAELDDFRETHSPKPTRNLYGRLRRSRFIANYRRKRRSRPHGWGKRFKKPCGGSDRRAYGKWSWRLDGTAGSRAVPERPFVREICYYSFSKNSHAEQEM